MTQPSWAPQLLPLQRPWGESEIWGEAGREVTRIVLLPCSYDSGSGSHSRFLREFPKEFTDDTQGAWGRGRQEILAWGDLSKGEKRPRGISEDLGLLVPSPSYLE